MAAGPGDDESETLTPDEAFSALGNAIRMDILRSLAEADSPLSFSELKRETDVSDPGQFHYHLDQLVGHFVSQTEAGYRLNRPGNRMIEAVLSGAVTEAPVIERTPLDRECPLCANRPIEIEYREEQLGVYCTACEGLYGGDEESTTATLPADRQRLHYAHLPPAGLAGRSLDEVLIAATTWTVSEGLMVATGICPSCSARLESTTEICESHEGSQGLCPSCNRRYSMLYQAECTNCIFDVAIVYGVTLLANPQFRRFLIDHGLDPLRPESVKFGRVINRYKEDIKSLDPLEATFTFTLEDETIRLTVDDDHSIVDVNRTGKIE